MLCQHGRFSAMKNILAIHTIYKASSKITLLWTRYKLREPLIHSCSKLQKGAAHLFGLYLVWKHSLWAVPSSIVFIQKPDTNLIDVLYGMVLTCVNTPAYIWFHFISYALLLWDLILQATWSYLHSSITERTFSKLEVTLYWCQELT